MDEVKPFQRKNATNEPQHAGVFDVKNKLKKLHSINKTRTSKVGAISKAQKENVSKICPGRIYEKLRKQFRDTQRVPLILDKTPKLLIPRLRTKKQFFSFGKCHIAPKKVKRALLDLSRYILLQIIKKFEGGPLRHLKLFERKSHSALKNRHADFLVSSSFVVKVLVFNLFYRLGLVLDLNYFRRR